MRTILKIALILLSVAGFAISYLLQAMQSPQTAGLARVLCATGERINCADVLGSAWAQIGPVSTSLCGCAYFLFLTIWYGAVGLPDRRGRAWHVVPTLTTLGGMGVSAWLMSVMATRLAVWCPWCVAAHGVNLLLLIGTLWAWRTFRERTPLAALAQIDQQAVPIAHALGSAPRMEPPIHPTVGRVVAAAASWLAVVVMVGLFGYAQTQSMTAALWREHWMQAANSAEYIQWRLRYAPRVEIPIRADDPSLGNALAPHTVVVFSDFQCPACRQLDAFLRDLAARQPGRVRVVFKHYPLCSDCNRFIPPNIGGQHRFACAAARASEAVRRLAGADAERKYRELLFAHAEQFAERPYEALAREVGLADAAALRRTMNDAATTRRIAEDVELAAQVGVNASGTAFLDRRRLPAWQIVDARDPSRIDVEATARLWQRLLNQ